MYDIIQFQLKEDVIDVSANKIIYSHYNITNGLLEINFNIGDPLILKITFEQFQEFDKARNKLAIIEEQEDVI